MKFAPLSEVTKAGTPKRLTQEWRTALAVDAAVASIIGIARTSLEVLHMAVSRYLYL